MKNFRHAQVVMTTAEIEALLCGSLDAGFRAYKKLREYGVPVIGKTWPVSVEVGTLTLDYDEMFGTFTWRWDADGALLDREKHPDWFSLTYEPSANPVHVAHAVRRSVERIGGVPIGASWVMGLENGLLRTCYDEAFNEVLFWREER